MSDLGPYWVDQLWHQQRARGCAKLIKVDPVDAEKAARKEKRLEGLRRYWERRRAAAAQQQE